MGFFLFLTYFIQHCFICRPSDSTLPMDAGIEPRIVATGPRTVATGTQDRCNWNPGPLQLEPRTVATGTRDRCNWNPGPLQLDTGPLQLDPGPLRSVLSSYQIDSTSESLYIVNRNSYYKIRLCQRLLAQNCPSSAL